MLLALALLAAPTPTDEQRLGRKPDSGVRQKLEQALAASETSEVEE